MEDKNDIDNDTMDEEWIGNPSVQEWLSLLRNKIQRKRHAQRGKEVHTLYIQQDNPMEYVFQRKHPPQNVPSYVVYSVHDEEIKTFLRVHWGVYKTRPSLQYYAKHKKHQNKVCDLSYCDHTRIAVSLIINTLSGRQKHLALQDQANLCRLQGAKHTMEYSKEHKSQERRKYQAHNIPDAPILVAQPFFHIPYDTYRHNHYPYHATFQQHHDIDSETNNIGFISYAPLHPSQPSCWEGHDEEDTSFRCTIKITDMVPFLTHRPTRPIKYSSLHMERSLLGACAYPLYDYISNIRKYAWDSPLVLKSKYNYLKNDKPSYSREDHQFSYEVIRSLLPSSIHRLSIFNPFLLYARIQPIGEYILPASNSKLSEYIRHKKDMVHYNKISRQMGYSNIFMLHSIYAYLNYHERESYKALPKRNMLSVKALYLYEIRKIYPFYLSHPLLYFRYRQLYPYHLYKLLTTKDKELIRETINILPSILKAQISYFQYTKNRPYDNRLQHRFVALLNFLYHKSQEVFPKENIHLQVERTWHLLTQPLPT